MNIKENFLPKKFLNELINYHKNNFDIKNNLCQIHENKEVIMCEKGFKKIEKFLNNFIKKINKNYVINYFEIVKWPCGESQEEHFDFEYHPYTTILYLNDDFEGGETVVEHKHIIPEKNIDGSISIEKIIKPK